MIIAIIICAIIFGMSCVFTGFEYSKKGYEKDKASAITLNILLLGLLVIVLLAYKDVLIRNTVIDTKYNKYEITTEIVSDTIINIKRNY